MSSFLFYSSPPPQSRQIHYQISPTSFFTPQVHGSRILGWPQSFSPASSPPQLSFQPAAAGPLTSTHANFLRSPMKATKHVHFENENSHAHADTDANADAMQEDYQLYGTRSPTTQEKKPLDTFTPLPSLPSLPSQQQQQQQQRQQQQDPRFRFQQRSREMSSSALLSTTIANARTSRQSGSRFLDRLRQSRHDRRDRRGAEAVERIDFFHEKRNRAAYFEQEAGDEVELVEDWDDYAGNEEDDHGDGDEEAQEGEMFDDAQMSPVEDKEVEELVRRYYEPDEGRPGATGISTGMSMGGDGLGGVHNMDLWRGDEDLEYDRALMELLSQEDSSAALQTGASLGHPGMGDRIVEMNAPDRDMEMS